LAWRLLAEPGNPYTKTEIAQTLRFSRGLYYHDPKLDKKDEEIRRKIEDQHETDDTLGHKKLGKLLKVGKNRAKRVMRKFAITARRRKKKYEYPGKSHTVFPNLANNEYIKKMADIIYSDIFEFQLADKTKVRGCFALHKRTRQVLSLVFDYGMKANLVTATIDEMNFVSGNIIWHTDQGSQYGAEITINKLITKGLIASMSRAGTPTDNPYAERFVGMFKLAVCYRRKYHTLGEFLRAAEDWINFYNQKRPHEGLGQLSPNTFAKQNNLKIAPYITLI
jgi:putative transposase